MGYTLNLASLVNIIQSYNHMFKTASGGSAVLPEPEAVTGEEEIPLPDDSLADTDLHDHDLIDSVMYIYFGASGHDQAPPGRQVSHEVCSEMYAFLKK